MILTSHYTVASLPKSRNFLVGVPVSSMHYALRTAFDLLKLTPIKDSLTVNQVVAAFQNHATLLEDTIGRNPDDLITDLNQFIADNYLTGSTKKASADDLVVHCRWSRGYYKIKSFLVCPLTQGQAEVFFFLMKFPDPPDHEGLWGMRTILDLIGTGKRMMAIGRTAEGEFYLRWHYKATPPNIIDLRYIYEEAQKNYPGEPEIEWRPTETIPEDFYS